MSKNEISEILKRYIPEKAVPQIAEWFAIYKVHMTVSQERSSKFGDYRAPVFGKGHRISVNATLNQYAFLITLVHEFAHLFVWEKYKNSVAPHGEEWKMTFRKSLKIFLDLQVFPTDITIALLKHLADPPASSSKDLALQKILKRYNKQEHEEEIKTLHLDELPPGTKFYFQNRLFVKKENLRKYVRCQELSSKNYFKIHPLVEITIYENPNP
jgi:hypothetical protein